MFRHEYGVEAEDNAIANNKTQTFLDNGAPSNEVDAREHESNAFKLAELTLLKSFFIELADRQSGIVDEVCDFFYFMLFEFSDV